MPDPVSPVSIERAKGEIRFDHVSFGYSPEKILMKNISFMAAPGQKIAVVGSTDAGKTTLVNLLMRFYEINSGNIIEQGNHKELLKKKGAYAKLYYSQFE